MKRTLTRYLPSLLETWGIAFATIIILLLGNGHDLLERYGLIQSSQIVKDQLAHGVGSGLGKLDSFTATRSVVSFAIWGIVGLIAFSVVQAVLRMIAHRKFEQELSSNNYVHPAGFDPSAFWKNIILHAIASFVLLVLSVTGFILYLVTVLPSSFRHARLFLLNPSLGHISQLLIGLVILFVGTWLFYAIIKVTVQHHRFNQV